MGDGTYTCATCGDDLDIVAIVTHECGPMLAAPDLSRRERNTLMYVEHRVVDHRGNLDSEQMNWDDRQNLKLFFAAGLLDISEDEGEKTRDRHGIKWMDRVDMFTDAAWDLARDCRQLRAADQIEHDADLGDVPVRVDA
jgi:hypothetical protein